MERLSIFILALCSFGLALIILLFHREKKIVTTYAICQNCGYTWIVHDNNDNNDNKTKEDKDSGPKGIIIGFFGTIFVFVFAFLLIYGILHCI